jgi:hypothetical protein
MVNTLDSSPDDFTQIGGIVEPQADDSRRERCQGNAECRQTVIDEEELQQQWGSPEKPDEEPAESGEWRKVADPAESDQQPPRGDTSMVQSTRSRVMTAPFSREGRKRTASWRKFR